MTFACAVDFSAGDSLMIVYFQQLNQTARGHQALGTPLRFFIARCILYRCLLLFLLPLDSPTIPTVI